MTESQDHRREARELLTSRLADMRYYLSDEYADSDYEGDDEHGSHYDWALSWDKYLTNHRDETVTYVHVLSTGGPHDEFQVTFDTNEGAVTSVKYVYLPWFDRVEIDCGDGGATGGHDVTAADSETVVSFYETFYDAAELEG